MPEFELDHGTREAGERFRKLGEFAQGYIEAAFFTSCGPDDEELSGASLDELHASAWDKIAEECAAWEAAHASLLERAYARDYDAEAAGRDYWFTRNGHGVGFWDRRELEAEGLGDELSNAAGRREVYLYRGDDGAIYYGEG